MNIITEIIRLRFPMNFHMNSPGFFSLQTFRLRIIYAVSHVHIRRIDYRRIEKNKEQKNAKGREE